MFISAHFRCDLCGQEVPCLDEQDRCEQCVLRAERLAAELLTALEELVRSALESGLSEELLRQAFEMSLADCAGELAELSIRREPRAADRRGVWGVAPYSAWLDEMLDYEPNRIRRLRRERGLSADLVAERLGVAVAELALWEHTPEVPSDVVEQLATMFGVSVPHLMKTDLDWLQG